MDNSEALTSVEQLFERIRQLTTDAAQYVTSDDIEQCQQAVQQRLELLKSLYRVVESKPELELDGQTLVEAYQQLCLWLKNVDEKAMQTLSELKQSAQSKSLKQIKTKHALKQYQSYYR